MKIATIHIKDNQQIIASRHRGNVCSKLTQKDAENNHYDVLGDEDIEEKYNFDSDSVSNMNEIPSLKKKGKSKKERNASTKNMNEITLDVIDAETRALRENEISKHSISGKEIKVERSLCCNKELGKRAHELEEIKEVNNTKDYQCHEPSCGGDVKLDESNRHNTD